MTQTQNIFRERRSIHRFLPGEIDQKSLEQILEAGRWAPSWINSQPWNFIIITDNELKRRVGEIGGEKTIFSKADWMADAAAIIVVAVDPEIDANHYVEDGAIATQNMALAAHSLGYGSYYLGVFDQKNKKGTAEDRLRKILNLPKKMRVISILPLGIPERDVETKSTRKELKEIVRYNSYE
jgi:nitroreductase